MADEFKNRQTKTPKLYRLKVVEPTNSSFLEGGSVEVDIERYEEGVIEEGTSLDKESIEEIIIAMIKEEKGE